MANLARMEIVEGWEHGFLSTLILGNSFSNAAVIPEAARSGSYGCRLTATNNIAGVSWSGTSATKHLRFYFKFNTLPNSDCYFAYQGQVSGAAHYVGLAYKNSTGALRPFGFTTTSGHDYGPDGFVPQAGIWYRLDAKFGGGSDPTSVDWSIDGVAQASYTPSVSGGGALGIPIIGNSNSVNTTMTLDIDDIIWVWHSATPSGTQSPEYPIGPGEVVIIRPNLAGTHATPSAFQDSNSNSPPASTAWNLIDDTLASTSDTDKIWQDTSNANAYLEYHASNLPTTTQNINGLKTYFGLKKHTDTSILVSLRIATVLQGAEEREDPQLIGTSKKYESPKTPQVDVTIDDVNALLYRFGWDDFATRGANYGSKTGVHDIFTQVDVSLLPPETPLPPTTNFYQPGTPQAYIDAKMNTGFEHGSLSTGEYTLGQGTFREIGGDISIDTEKVRENSVYSLKVNATSTGSGGSSNEIAGMWIWRVIRTQNNIDAALGDINTALAMQGSTGFAADFQWEVLELGRIKASATASAGATTINLSHTYNGTIPNGTVLYFDHGGMANRVAVTLTAKYNPGATSLSVQALSANVNSGARAGIYDDTLLNYAYNVSASKGKRFKPGFVAGEFTPSTVYTDGSPSFSSGGLNHPLPFGSGGSTNTAYEEAWEDMLQHLFDWARNKNSAAGYKAVPMVNAPWYSGPDDDIDLYFGTEFRNAYSDPVSTNESRVITSHKRLLDLAQPITVSNDITVAFSVSGVGAIQNKIASDLVDHMANIWSGVYNPLIYAQSIRWNPLGDWGSNESQMDLSVFNKGVLIGERDLRPDKDTQGARTATHWQNMFGYLASHTPAASYVDIWYKEFHVETGVQTSGGLTEMTSQIASFSPVTTGATSYAIINAWDEKVSRTAFNFFDPSGDPWGILAARKAITKPAGAVTINAPTNIQNVINSNPAGTTYWLNGTFNVGQKIVPKNGDTFITNNAVLDGGLKFTSGSRLTSTATYTGTDICFDIKNGIGLPDNPKVAVTVKGFHIRNFSDIGIRPWLGTFVSHCLIQNCVGNGIGGGFQNVPYNNGNSRQAIIQDTIIWDCGSVADLGKGSGGIKLARTGDGENLRVGTKVRAATPGSGVKCERVYSWRNIGNGIWFDVTPGGDLVTNCIADENSRKGIFISEVGVGPSTCEYSMGRNNATWVGEAPRPASDYGIITNTSLNITIKNNIVTGNGDNNGIKVGEQGNRIADRGHGTDNITVTNNNLLDNDELNIDPEASNVTSFGNNNKGLGVEGPTYQGFFDPTLIDNPPAPPPTPGPVTKAETYAIRASVTADSPPPPPVAGTNSLE